MDWENLQVTLPFVACCAVFSPIMQVEGKRGLAANREVEDHGSKCEGEQYVEVKAVTGYRKRSKKGLQ